MPVRGDDAAAQGSARGRLPLMWAVQRFVPRRGWCEVARFRTFAAAEKAVLHLYSMKLPVRIVEVQS